MRKGRPGVAGFDDARFWISFACLALSLPLFFEGGVSWETFRLVMPLLIAFIVVATLAWDFRLVGDPNEPHCLVLHAMLLASLVFLLNRLTAAGDFLPLPELPGAAPLVGEFLGGAVGFFLRLAVFSLQWLGYAVILFFVAGAVIFPKRIAVALLFLFGLAFVAVSAGRSAGPELWTLALGLVLQAAAFVLQLGDDGGARFWNRVAEACRRGGPLPAADAEVKIALLRRLRAVGRLDGEQFRAVVASRLGARPDDPLLSPACIRAAEQLCVRDGLAESRNGAGGWSFVLSVPDGPPDFFTLVARVVRVGLTLCFSAVYVLSPVDFIPDMTPVLGVADDLLLGTIGLLSAFRTLRDGDGR